jgi:hypothetical protein
VITNAVKNAAGTRSRYVDSASQKPPNDHQNLAAPPEHRGQRVVPASGTAVSCSTATQEPRVIVTPEATN